MKKILSVFAAAIGLVVLALPVHAQSWEYSFGTWLGDGPVYQPANTFASLSISTTDYLAFDFTLRAYDPVGGNLSSEFGSSAYIGQAIFNSLSGENPIGISNVQTNGVTNVFLTGNDPNVGGVTFDFGDCFGGGGSCSHGGSDGRLQSGEWASWTLSFASVQNPFLGDPAVALHVQSFGVGNEDSGWYTPTSPIPEPETYAMLLAGLGLMGFVIRRRRSGWAAA